MAKRFIDTTIWTQNKWFRKLSPRHKLLWIYLFCNCDVVGVWEEDFELVSFIIGEDFKRTDIDEAFKDKVKWFSPKKLWIIDFCNFQYGELKEENITNKPHQSYISLLKKHSLWIDYCKAIKNPLQRVKEKDKDKDPDKAEVKVLDFIDQIIEQFIEAHGNYIVINRGKEREAAGKLLNIYKKKNPDADSDETLQSLRTYFNACVNIGDSWLHDNMSLSIIVSKFNEINNYLKNGKHKGSGITDTELAELMARKHGIDDPGR